MYDLRYRCIFIHQRKAAGTSIIRAFGKTPSFPLGIKNPEWHWFNNGVLGRGWAYRPPFYVFSAVRNPFDRVVSAWKFLKATRDRPLEEVLLHPPSSSYVHVHLTRPQIASLRTADGSLVTDDLVRFESLQADFDRVCDRLGKPRVLIPHANAGPREAGYRQYFNAESRRLAEELFKDDLETFGYDF